MQTRWKFLRLVDNKIKSNSGDCEWEIGEWKHEENLYMCEAGFHCSKEVYQAFSYVQGEILAKVEVEGKHESQYDKEVWTDMRIIEAYKWQKKDSVSLSIYSAELCIKKYEKVYPNDKRPREAIDAAKKWLDDPTKENESAASVAASAAESARWSAESAAWSAKSVAAWSVARSAASVAASVAASAESVEWSVAASAESAKSVAASAESVKKIFKWMSDRVNKLEKIK